MSLFDWSLISFMDLPTSLRSSIDEASSDSALFYCMMLVMRSMTLFSFNVTPIVLVTLLVFWMHIPISSEISMNFFLSVSLMG